MLLQKSSDDGCLAATQKKYAEVRVLNRDDEGCLTQTEINVSVSSFPSLHADVFLLPSTLLANKPTGKEHAVLTKQSHLMACRSAIRSSLEKLLLNSGTAKSMSLDAMIITREARWSPREE